MTSLADIVNHNKKLVRGPGGQLTEETTEETQNLTGQTTPLNQLAGQAGLQVPPITPLGAAAIGANPDQQKMAGSAQQKQAALSIAQAPDDTLQGAMRRGQVRSEATAEEKQGQEKSADMANLGSLGDRVTDFINAQRNILEQKAGQGVQVNTAGSFQNGIGQNVELGSLKDLLQQYRDNPTDQNTLLKINQSLGYNINTQLSPQQVDQLYESTVDSISRGAAGNIDNDLNVDDLVNVQGFGYDKPTLSNLLGVPVDQIGKMSVGEIRNKINEVAANEFSKTQQLEQQAQSGQLGQAERGLARQEAMEASRTGQRSSEADVSSLEQQIANADQVTFAGRQFKVDDLLKDETISGIIAEYMNSAPDSDVRKQIDSQEKGLSDFIQKNQAVLQDASQHMQQGAQTFTETQDFNRSLQTVPFGGVKLDDNLAKLFIPGFGTLQASRVDINSVPILRAASEQGPQYGQTFANNINSEYQKDPNTADDLNGLDYDMIKAWDIGGGSNSNWSVNYIQPKRFYEQIQAASPEDRDSLMKMAFTNATSADSVQGKLSANRSSNVLGFGSSLNAGIADQNGDGVLDKGEDIRNALLSANPRPTLRNGPAAVKKYTAAELAEPTVPSTGVDGSIFQKLAGAAAKGQVTDDDLKAAGLNLEEAIRTRDLSKSGGHIDQGAASSLWSGLRDNSTNDGIAKAMGSTDRIAGLNNLMNMDDDHVNKTLVRNKLAELGAISEADRQAQEAADKDKTHKRVAQQNELKTVLTAGAWAALPPETQEALNKMGNELSAGQLQQLKGTIDWNPNRTVGENTAILARNLTTLPYRQAQDAAQILQKNILNGNITNTLGGALKSYGNQISDVAKNPGKAAGNAVNKVLGGGDDGCFIAGTRFLLSDGSTKEVDKLTPYDKLLMGGRTVATAQFICDEMYCYLGVFVSGFHAVIEDGHWIRIRDSKRAERTEELDGSVVYVVWNTGHRMVHETGIVFSDYAETDSTVAEIEAQRNINVLNSQASS